jgi:hypothetical protein
MVYLCHHASLKIKIEFAPVLEIRSTSSSIVPGRIVERNTTVNVVARAGLNNSAI